MIDGVATVPMLDGEKVKFPGTRYVPVSEQFPPLSMRDTSVTIEEGCPEATLRDTIALTYCQVVEPLWIVIIQGFEFPPELEEKI